MKRRPPNPYDNPAYKMVWGRYAGKRIKRIPAQYWFTLEREGWMVPDLQEWINRNREELETRAKEEDESGYTKQYELQNSFT